MDRIVIDQHRICFRPEFAHRVRPDAQFPRSLEWWQRFVPLWLTASQDEGGRIVLVANGWTADGRVLPLTAVQRCRALRQALRWLAHLRAVDMIAAILTEEAPVQDATAR